jgi:alkanesulfonate monooxygenase SsuD/methylene tetrahydromethanopterin reductase-like flavin-dependent oxidoreductase (luciferase family)
MEAAGIDHVVAGDHVSFIAGLGTDGLIRAAVLAALSESLEIHLGVYLLPLRHPVLVARQLSTLSLAAPGRVVLGVGVGGEDRHEVELTGVDPSTRGRRMDECLQVLRGLATGEPFDFHGKFFQLTEALVLPEPSPPVPLIVGGRSDAAVLRAGRLGDGWLGIWVSPSRFSSVVAQAAEEAGRAGRGDVDWRHAMQMWCAIGDSRDAARRMLASRMEGFYRIGFEKFERYSPYGSPSDIAELCAGYVGAGCRSFNLLVQAPDADTHIEGVAEVRRLLNPA